MFCRGGGGGGEGSLVSSLGALLVEEQAQVVAREHHALARRLLRVDVDSSHEGRVGAVQRHQQAHAADVRQPVAQPRGLCHERGFVIQSSRW